MKTLAVLLMLFLAIGLFARRYDARTRLLLMTLIIVIVSYITLG